MKDKKRMIGIIMAVVLGLFAMQRLHDYESLDNNCFVYTDTKGNTVSPSEFADENGNVTIKVFAEAAQTATFENAYDALNTAFGTPGSEGYVAPWNK